MVNLNRLLSISPRDGAIWVYLAIKIVWACLCDVEPKTVQLVRVILSWTTAISLNVIECIVPYGGCKLCTKSIVVNENLPNHLSFFFHHENTDVISMDGPRINVFWSKLSFEIAVCEMTMHNFDWNWCYTEHTSELIELPADRQAPIFQYQWSMVREAAIYIVINLKWLNSIMRRHSRKITSSND